MKLEPKDVFSPSYCTGQQGDGGGDGGEGQPDGLQTGPGDGAPQLQLPVLICSGYQKPPEGNTTKKQRLEMTVYNSTMVKPNQSVC